MCTDETYVRSCGCRERAPFAYCAGGIANGRRPCSRTRRRDVQVSTPCSLHADRGRARSRSRSVDPFANSQFLTSRSSYVEPSRTRSRSRPARGSFFDDERSSRRGRSRSRPARGSLFDDLPSSSSRGGRDRARSRSRPRSDLFDDLPSSSSFGGRGSSEHIRHFQPVGGHSLLHRGRSGRFDIENVFGRQADPLREHRSASRYPTEGIGRNHRVYHYDPHTSNHETARYTNSSSGRSQRTVTQAALDRMAYPDYFPEGNRGRPEEGYPDPNLVRQSRHRRGVDEIFGRDEDKDVFRRR